MAFGDELRRFLVRGLDSARRPWPAEHEIISESEVRRSVRGSIEVHYERARSNPTSVDPQPLHAQAIDRFLTGTVAIDFVRRFIVGAYDRALFSSLAEARAASLRAMAREIAATFSQTNDPEGHEERAVADEAWAGLRRPGLDPLAYAELVGLSRCGVTERAGRVYTRLGGRSATEWLLTMEVEQSIGPSDPWRLSRSMAQTLMDKPWLLPDLEFDGDGRPLTPTVPPSLLRWHELGVIGFLVTGGERFEVHPEGRAILQDVLSGASELRGVARALLAQEQGSRLAERDAAVRADRRAAGWVVESMAHTLRNALTPALLALDDLESPVHAMDADARRRYGGRIRHGLERAFKAVTDLVGLYQSADAPAEPFVIRTAVLDAVLRANGAGVLHDLSALGDLMVRGARQRFVQALGELFMNARQMGAKTVAVTAEVDESRMLLHVDDDGPGVAPQNRERVFIRGFSTRPEGTGQGLALLQDVLSELGGQATVGESPRGGARFTVEIPRA